MTDFVQAEGWGYRKGVHEEKPKIGSYEEILEGFHAYYVHDSNEKNIYLTFDNGYEQGYTEEILDVLQEENVPAAFFVTGHYVESEPALVKRIVKEGHIIGNHSDRHPDFTTLSKREIRKELDQVEKAVASLTNQKQTHYVRPPRGTFNKKTMQILDDLGYIQMFWSLAFTDWEVNEQRGWRYAYEQMMKQVHPGAIVLLHAVSSDNAKALQKTIIDLRKKGYTFKSLDEFMIDTLLDENFLF